MTERPRIAVIFTGGTISMLPDVATGAAVPALDGRAILARVPALEGIADLDAIDWGLVPASHLRFAQILELSQLISGAAARPDVDGVVVVQGTDVLEETAYAWDLLHRGEAPVVVVGAMRNAGDAGYDGPRNLTDAVRVAADPRLIGAGRRGGHGRRYPAGGRCHQDPQHRARDVRGAQPGPAWSRRGRGR